MTHPTAIEAKRAAAIAWLGAKWLLHPANHVPKQPAPMVLDRVRAQQ
jgi:hypothetical protein